MTAPFTPDRFTNAILDSLSDDPRPLAEQCATVLRYCDDADFRAQVDAETAVNRARANASIDAGIARYRARIGVSKCQCDGDLG